MKTNMTEMRPEDLEKANGGTINPNKYTTSEYASAGIKCVTHLIEKDEFWWKGENIGAQNADAVMYFIEKNGNAPVSVEQAINYKARTMVRK